MAKKERIASVLIRNLAEKLSGDDENILVVEDATTTYKIKLSNIAKYFADKLKNTFVTLEQKGKGEGVAPLNINSKIDSKYLQYGDIAGTIYEGSAGKANEESITTHRNDIQNPHNVTKEQLGLDNVENKSSETIRGEITVTDISNSLGFVPEPEGALDEAKTYTDDKITELIGGASSTLDTLKEIEDAFAKDKSVIEALDDAIGLKADQDSLDLHAEDYDIHTDVDEKNKWNAAYEHSLSKHANPDASVVEASTTNGHILINDADTTVYTHPMSDVPIGNYSFVGIDATGHVISGSNPIIPVTKGGTGANNVVDALVNFGITATSSELNVLDGITAKTDELNYLVGMRGNLQKQLDSKADVDHGNHVPSYEGSESKSFFFYDGQEGVWHKLTKSDISEALGYTPGTGSNVITSVKGDAETEYHTGMVNITPAKIGLDKVDNVPDKEKSVFSAGQLSAARKIGDASFDGTQDITFEEIGQFVYSDTEPTNQSVNGYWIKEV